MEEEEEEENLVKFEGFEIYMHLLQLQMPLHLGQDQPTISDATSNFSPYLLYKHLPQ